MFKVLDFFNLYFCLKIIFCEKEKTQYISSDQDVVAALKRNGYFTTAPKNSCGCKHCAMSEMRKISASDFSYYIKRAEALYNQKCSGKMQEWNNWKTLAIQKSMW